MCGQYPYRQHWVLLQFVTFSVEVRNNVKASWKSRIYATDVFNKNNVTQMTLIDFDNV